MMSYFQLFQFLFPRFFCPLSLPKKNSISPDSFAISLFRISSGIQPLVQYCFTHLTAVCLSTQSSLSLSLFVFRAASSFSLSYMSEHFLPWIHMCLLSLSCFSLFTLMAPMNDIYVCLYLWSSFSVVAPFATETFMSNKAAHSHKHSIQKSLRVCHVWIDVYTNTEIH